MSTIITNEYRHDYAQAQQKLNIKSMFVGYVSHEVRTPLNSCKLGMEYLQGTIEGPHDNSIEEMSDILNDVLEGCETAIDFMNNLLLYEKIDSKELPLFLKREDLCTVCTQVHKSFRLSALELGIDLSLDIHKLLLNAEKGALAEIDAPKVIIVLRNLVSNSLKFTPKNGQVCLSITPVNLNTNTPSVVQLPASTPSDTTHFRVILSDTGRGMSREEQDKLFTKFIQFSPNETQKGGGSGIGLFLSHEIITKHNLKIQVSSEGNKGQGTKFYIDFPVAVERSDSEPYDMQESAPSPAGFLSHFPFLKRIHSSTHTPPIHDMEEGKDASVSISTRDLNTIALGGESTRPRFVQANPPSNRVLLEGNESKRMENLSILVVDDSAVNRKMLIKRLRQKGVGDSYDSTCDGLELLSLLGYPEMVEGNNKSDTMIYEGVQDKEYDLILLDDHMTRMHGVEAVKILRQYGYGGLIIGLTGHAQEEELHLFCKAGADYALPKPLEVDDLICIVQNHL